MVCPKCGSNQVLINMQEVSSKTSKKENSHIGKFGHKLARDTAGFFTLGVSNLFIPKNLQGKEKTKNKFNKIAICQDCGHDWKIWI